jgi:hypothetical protein
MLPHGMQKLQNIQTSETNNIKGAEINGILSKRKRNQI